MNNTASTMSLAILSGKGGVGKTNIALNLGYALNKSGERVLLMDFDMGLANIDVLLGISPTKNLNDLFLSDSAASEVICSIEDSGLDFLPATSGMPEFTEIDEDMREIIYSKLASSFARYEYLLLDLGAGISPTVLTLASLAQNQAVIITSEPTSLTDGYAVIKVLHNQYQCKKFNVIVNLASNMSEAKTTFERLNDACERFLNIKLEYLGGIHADPSFPEAVRNQVPLLKFAPNSPAAKDIMHIAAKLKKSRVQNLDALLHIPVLDKNRKSANRSPRHLS